VENLFHPGAPPLGCAPSADSPDEASRIETLHALRILDTAPEEEFDAITRTAARICDCPIALVSLVDRSRQWFKSRVGLHAPETPRELSFCAHAISSPALMEVPDATADERFCKNALVTQHPHIRFYAGVPLVMRDGFVPGTLCVIDRRPRQLTAEQAELLKLLGHQIVTLLELRRVIAEREAAYTAVRESEARFQTFMRHIPGPAWIKAAHTWTFVYVNPVLQRMFGLSSQELLGRSDFDFWPREIAEQVRLNDIRVAETRLPVRTDEVVPTPDGKHRHWRVEKFYFEDEQGQGYVGGTAMDVTREKEFEAQQVQLVDRLTSAMANLKTLSGLLPICAHCKKIRNSSGYWEQVESYIRARSSAEFSHGLCPECVREYWPPEEGPG
jgi:PAS domain S-box-containing protein